MLLVVTAARAVLRTSWKPAIGSSLNKDEHSPTINRWNISPDVHSHSVSNWWHSSCLIISCYKASNPHYMGLLAMVISQLSAHPTTVPSLLPWPATPRSHAARRGSRSNQGWHCVLRPGWHQWRLVSPRRYKRAARNDQQVIASDNQQVVPSGSKELPYL